MTDTTKFTKDLAQYFQDNSANKEQAAEYIRNFEKLWKESKVAGYFKEIIMTTSNTMLTKRMKPYPYFYGYLNTVVNAITHSQTGEGFENWQACVDKILAGKSLVGVQDYFDMSENIFKNNVFYKTPSYSYYSVEPSYTFSYDTIPRVKFENITSPSKLTHRIMNTMKRLGKTHIHHAPRVKKDCACCIMLPHVEVGCCTPRPRKET